VLSGSAQRAAAVVLSGDEDHGFSQLFSGPPAGPLTALGPPLPTEGAFTPLVPFVEDDRLTVLEADENWEHARLRDSDGVSFGLPGLVDDVAGDLYALSGARRLVIRNWRTGAERAIAMPRRPEWVELRTDGAALVGLHSGGVLAVSPQGAIRRVSRSGGSPRFAGDGILFEEDDGLMLAAPGARPRPFGPRTGTLGDVDADDKHVLWHANGCLLVADVATPASATPPPGPCRRVEVARENIDTTLARDRTLSVVLRCYAAVRACRGTVRLVLIARNYEDAGSTPTVRFSIRAGERRRVKVRLGEKLYHRARHGGWGRDVPFRGVIKVADADGSHFIIKAGLIVSTVR